MLKVEPKQIYLVAVIEFLENLDPTTLTMEVTCTDPNTLTSYNTTVELKKLMTEMLKLHDFGQNIEEAGHKVYIAKLR